MTSNSKIHEAEMMLNDLMLCDRTFDIPGNFRAKQRRVKHDESKQVFPAPKKKPTENFKTHYNNHFQRKKGARPSSPRPCSPTRRNNPHPSKNFLSWRIPTRVFDYGKGKDANVSFLKSNVNDTYQSFYDDYAGKSAGLKREEVDPKLLLEIAKSYSSPTQKKDRRLNTSYDLRKPKRQKDELTLPNVLRHSWSPNQSSFGIPDKSEKGRKVLSPIFMKPEFRPLFQSWYDAASENEKEETEKAFVEAEKKYIEEALSLALKPDAVEAIEQWLSNADEEEREIAMQFIKAIILASVERSEDPSESPPETPNTKYKNFDQFLGGFTPGKTNTSHHNHSTRKACDVCQKQDLQAALQQLQAVAAMPMEVPGITELLNPLHPAVIAEKQLRKPQPMAGKRHLNRPQHQRPVFHANKGSLFVTSKKHKARHFTIHPEWF